MKKLPPLPEIPEEKQTPLVKSLLVMLEQFAERIQQQDEAIQQLKDEVNSLKGEKKQPTFKPSKLDQQTDRDFIVQDLHIQAHNTRYRLEYWLTPEGDTLTRQRPPTLRNRHFGPDLTSYILYQHPHCQTTQPLLLEQLCEWGIDISSGQINRLLLDSQTAFHQEKETLLQAGLDVSSYVTVDDSGARHHGKNGYVTHIGNDFFGWFESTPSKSRINFLELLCAGRKDYHVTAEAIDYMSQQKRPIQPLNMLSGSVGRLFESEEQWRLFLGDAGITCTRHCRMATEGVLLGSLLQHGDGDNLAIISDGAGQFNVLSPALCWVHTERLIHKTLPLNETHRQEIAQLREQIWTLYKALKAYKSAPTESQKAVLACQFDEIFTQKIRYITLNQTLKRIHSNKAKLLLVLERPDIPLHTNGSETDIRDYVKKRKVSGGTRSDEGRRCRDTFASLKKTYRKLGVSFWQYLLDRLSTDEQMIPPLADLVREKAAATGY